MNERLTIDMATATRLPAACADTNQRPHLDWRILVVGAGLCSTVAWIGFVVWLVVWASGLVLA